ncbi:MAG TPA: peptide ABC transporter substrate-binding protein [Tepidisphaeraceae bacterium]|nr:peptide ABC transporter substrate-binding protein [Tepidisphaeraceae bacterium]
MLRLLVIPLAFLVMLVGAMVWSGGGATKRASFAFINRGDIHTLDLNQMSYMQDFRFTYAIREGLFNLDPVNYRPEPAVAESVALDPDPRDAGPDGKPSPLKRVYTFRLRPGVKWGNGDPITTADFVFSWRRMLQEPGEYSYLFDYIEGAEGYKEAYGKGDPQTWDKVRVEAPDERTLKVTLKNPVRYFLDLIAFPPFYPRHERSMARFRLFTDADVMDAFEKYVEGAKRLDPGGDAAAALARAAGDAGRKLDAAGAAKFVEAVRAGFEYRPNDRNRRAAEKDLKYKFATEAELLDVLVLFLKTGALDGTAAKDKLGRMVERRFVRYVFDKKYTQPPYAVGNGPFNLARWDFKARLVAERNPHFWDAANVKSDSIEMVVSENQQSQLLMYETGVVDWLADVAGEQASELRGRGDLRTSDAFGTNFLTLMCAPNLAPSVGKGKNVLADVRVRQALAMTIDKREIVRNVTRMGELPARTYMPPDGTLPEFRWLPGPIGNSGEPAGKTYTFSDQKKMLPEPGGLEGPGPGLPYDPQAARKLLAEAGYPGGANFPKYPILYNTGNTTRKQIAQVVKEHWRRELGIDLPIQGVEGKIFQQRVTEKDYFIATVAWYGDYPDISTFTDKYHSKSLQNDSDWVRPAFDELLAAAEKEPDAGARAATLAKAMAMLDGEAPIIPLYHYVNISMSRDAVFGVKPNPRNIVVWKGVGVKK